LKDTPPADLSVRAQITLSELLHVVAFISENFIFIYLGLTVWQADAFVWDWG
jgi:hypothetical protein